MNILVVVDGNAQREAWESLAAECGHAVRRPEPGQALTPSTAAGFPLVIASCESATATAALCREVRRPGSPGPTILAVATDDESALAIAEAGASHVVPAGANAAARRAALLLALRTAALAERAREAEARVNDLVEDANDLIYTHDLQGVITSGNRAAESITGYLVAELIGTNISSLVAPDHLPQAQEMTRRKVAGVAGQTAYEIDIIRKDGVRAPLEVSTRIVFKDGRPFAVQGIGRDTSERKRHEDALRASEQRFSLLFAHSPEPLALAAANDCTLVDVNERMLALTGYSRDEFVGSTAKALHLWEEEGFPDRVLGHLATEAACDRWEVGARTKDGTLLTTLFSAERVQFSGEDFVFFTISDISERKRAEEALRESEARTRLIIDTALDAVVTIDASGSITAWNAQAEAIFGWPAREAIGRELAATIVRPGDREPHREGLRRFLQTGEAHILGRRREVIAMRRDGSEFPAELAVTPIVSASGETSFSAFIRDIAERERAEQTLRVSEANYRAVIDGTSDAIFVLDRDEAGDFRCVLVNRAFEELTHLRSADIVGRAPREVLPPTDAAWAESRYAVVAEAGGTVEYEESFTLGRRQVHLITTLTPVYADDGLCRRIIGSSRDVTARKAAEDALRASEINYRAVFDNISDGLCVMERGPDGQFRCTTINAAYCDLLDRTPEMVLNKTLQESLGPEAPDGQRRVDAAIAARGPIQREWSREDRAGRIRHAITQLTPLFAGDGTCYRLIGSLREVTGLRQAEEAQERAEALASRLGRLLDESASEVYVLETGTFRILQVNRGARNNLGYTEAELRTMTIPDINPEFDADRWAPITAPLFAGERDTIHAETTVRRKDGSTYVGDVSLSLSRSETPPVFLAVVQDITDRKRQEEALLQAQKLESLGVLAGGIAHDFNNLLVGILGNAGLALMELPPASPARDTIEQIETAGRHAADLARQMLAYSGKGRFVIQPIDLNSLVEEMTHLLRVSLNKGVSLHYDLAANLAPVEGDITQLRQVVMNLVVNASDAIGQESGIITIATEVVQATREDLASAHLSPDLPAGDYVSLSIRDTGAGMDAETRAKIFDPFFTTKFTGRGLGLAAVLGIVRGHHGAIRIDSTPGRGSAFTLLLPRSATAAETAPGAEAPAPEWKPSGSILVVDDEDTVRRVTARALSSLGLTVLTAADGFEAVEIFREHHREIRCTLLDMTMPGMDGEQTFCALREIDPTARVVLMSGYTEQDATSRFASDGLAGFIQKPYEIATLRDVIRQVIDTTG